MYKASANFICNQIEKRAGESLSENEEKALKEELKDLLDNQLIEEILIDPKPVAKKKKVFKKKGK